MLHPQRQLAPVLTLERSNVFAFQRPDAAIGSGFGPRPS